MVYAVYDIETLKGLFLYVSRNLTTGELSIFRIDKFRNDLYALVKHLREEKVDFLVSFNGLAFDSQVVQFILTNFEDWAHYSSTRIAAVIYQFAQDVIDDSKYRLPLPFEESRLWRRQIDLFKIHHYDNDSRRVSLKWLEYSMDFPTIEGIPVDHRRDTFSEAEISQIVRYCINDVEATTRLYYITRGETDIEEYAGKDKIQDRFDIIAEYSLPKYAVSWSDVKIGDEINKIGYCKAAGLADTRAVYWLKEKRKSNAGFTFGSCIPAYVTFRTPEFKSLYDKVKSVRVNLNEDQEFQLQYNGTTYVIKKGGIHSTEKSRIISAGDWIIADADVGSQYPNSIVKRNLYPSHLGAGWLVNYKKTIELRLYYKGKSNDKSLSTRERRKYKGLAEFLKLALNGGGFGKTNERNSWQYDPKVHFSCTIGNQFEMLMLIEALEIEGIHVISANTDGIVCHYPKEKQTDYERICHWWESVVGNTEMGQLEFTYYSTLVQTSVNDYLAIKDSGDVKKKGDFQTSHELHKNKSRRVIPIALEKYFVSNISVEETIRTHENLLDFCIGVKSSKNYHYSAIDQKTGQGKEFSGVVRYYVSCTGLKLLKVKNADAEGKGVKVQQCEAGTWLSTVVNEISDLRTGNVDFEYYIAKAKQIIAGIETPATKSRKKPVISNPNQLSLFS